MPADVFYWKGLLVYRDDSQIHKEHLLLLQRTGSSSQNHTGANICPLLQFQETQCFLPASEGTAHMWCSYMYVCKMFIHRK